MTDTIAINWENIQNALYNWVSSKTDIAWIWANQDAPQPSYPYGVLNIISGPVKIGFDELRYLVSDDKLDLDVVGNRQFTCSLQVNIGPPDADVLPNYDSRALMSYLQATLGLPSVQDLFRTANFSVINAPVAEQFDQVVADFWISRTQMDLICQTTSCITETDTDAFDKVKVSSDIEGAPDSIQLDDYLIGG